MRQIAVRFQLGICTELYVVCITRQHLGISKNMVSLVLLLNNLGIFVYNITYVVNGKFACATEFIDHAQRIIRFYI